MNTDRQVMTVTGPVPSRELGLTLPHEHLLIDLTRQVIQGGRINDLALLERELNAFADAGGKTLVDCTTDEIGRDPEALKTLSTSTGINIVMGCGFYREPYINKDWIDEHGTDRLAQHLIDEIEYGVGDTGIRPGVIGEIGSERSITALEERILRAAAKAHLETGLTITTHTARWPNGLKQLAILRQEGVDATHVVIGHCDTIPSVEYHAAIAAEGAYVEFDTIRGDNDYDTEQRIGFILSLIQAGHMDRILLSHDVCVRSHLRALGGPGYTFVPAVLAERLVQRGLSESDLHTLLVENPRRALTGSS